MDFSPPFLCFRCRKNRDTESTWPTKGKEQVMLLAGGLFCRSRWEMMPADLCPLLKSLLGWGWSAAGGQTPKGQGGEWGNCLGSHKIWEVFAQDFWSATSRGLGRSYLVAHHSREGTPQAVYIRGAIGATVLLDFPAAFQRKASLGWILVPSRARQAGVDTVSGAELGEGKSWIKWWPCKMIRAETCLALGDGGKAVILLQLSDKWIYL